IAHLAALKLKKEIKAERDSIASQCPIAIPIFKIKPEIKQESDFSKRSDMPIITKVRQCSAAKSKPDEEPIDKLIANIEYNDNNTISRAIKTDPILTMLLDLNKICNCKGE